MMIGRETQILIAIVGGALTLVIASAVQPWIDPRWLYMDAQTVGELSGDCCHIYDGAMSMLGIKLWSATAACSILCGVIALLNGWHSITRFSAHSALVSGVLAIDDAFLLHDVVLPKLAISQSVVIGLIGVLILSYLFVQRRSFERRYLWLLAVSLISFAVSVGIDQVFHSIETVWIVLEDGPKFVGIVTWFLFHLMVMARMIVDQSRVSEVDKVRVA